MATALTAAGYVSRGTALALALCRPPGHHVSVDAFGGGCYLNNAAITAQWFRDQGADKIAIVDVDFHHGNGTQAIFYDRADVSTLRCTVTPTVAIPISPGMPMRPAPVKARG